MNSQLSVLDLFASNVLLIRPSTVSSTKYGKTKIAFGNHLGS